MFDTMNEIVSFSPFGGKLVLDEVKGTVSGKLNPENDVHTVEGADRNMYTYIPSSGCPHTKQAQVLMVLRDDSSEKSAEKLMKSLQLDELAEQRHFILLFPNPLKEGWNYLQTADRDNDIQFLVRCFAALPKSKGHVAGFNGMIFYLGTSPASSAMASVLAKESPLDAAAIMIGRYPDGFTLPQGKKAPQTAWLYEENSQAEKWLQEADSPYKTEGDLSFNEENACIRFWLRNKGLNSEEISEAWEKMFSETRRWRNDTFGIYQPRINFSAKGFTAHVNDTSLGDNAGIPHTWYEYVPEKVKKSNEKIPLVLYFHGINCVALYGAEQSGWPDIADEEGLIVVFPDPAIEERWNVWDDRRIPSDMDYVMKLIEHMKTVHPIDESRIYVSGFSMGSMFSNALASTYPEVFAGAVACNGPDQGYLMTLDASAPGLKMFRPNTVTQNLKPNGETESPVKKITDQKKAACDYRMPFVQFAGILDSVGLAKEKHYPMHEGDGGMWIDTVSFWKKYDHVLEKEMFDPDTASGLKADKTEKTGRFIHQSWISDTGEELYHFILAERMPHAVDLNEIRIGWNIVKPYFRKKDGSLGKKRECLTD